MSDADLLIDTHAPRTNMYGCTACPKCGSKYRWADQKSVIRCDDCGHTVQGKRPPTPEELEEARLAQETVDRAMGKPPPAPPAGPGRSSLG